MTKYIFLLSLLLIITSCSSTKKNLNTEIGCPQIYISTEHENYFSSKTMDILDENLIDYTAAINNYEMKCLQTDRKAILSTLDILFIVTPLNENMKNFNYSYFVSILDDNENILDYQLFYVEGKFKSENQFLLETLVTESLDQYLPLQTRKYKIVIGFVLSDEKYNFINN